MDKYLITFREIISLRGLTDHTIKSYTTYIKAYLDYLQQHLHKEPEDVNWQELREFLLYLKQQRNLSDRTINHCISQLRFFTIYVLHKPWDSYQVPYRKFDTFLPYVPTREEVWSFISPISDIKLKTIVALTYSAGIRVGEASRLKYQDINRSEMKIYISKGKSRSDRYAILSENMLALLTEYWYLYHKPKGWLFSQPTNPEKPIDVQTLHRHFSRHREKYGFNPKITFHSFRHAFGSHLYENGVDLMTIKTLLGHKSLDSTTIYVSLSPNAIAKAVSPFDLMGGEHIGRQ